MKKPFQKGKEKKKVLDSGIITIRLRFRQLSAILFRLFLKRLRSLVGGLHRFCLGGVLFPLSPALIVDECLHAAPFHDLALEPNKVDGLRDDMLVAFG